MRKHAGRCGIFVAMMALIGSMLFRASVKKSPLLEVALALQFFFGSYEFPSFTPPTALSASEPAS